MNLKVSHILYFVLCYERRMKSPKVKPIWEDKYLSYNRWYNHHFYSVGIVIYHDNSQHYLNTVWKLELIHISTKIYVYLWSTELLLLVLELNIIIKWGHITVDWCFFRYFTIEFIVRMIVCGDCCNTLIIEIMSWLKLD